MKKIVGYNGILHYRVRIRIRTLEIEKLTRRLLENEIWKFQR